MKDSVIIIFLYLRQFFLARLQYKWDFIASLFSSAVSAIMGIVFLVALLNGSGVESLDTWSKGEVLFIYGYAGFATAIFSILAPNLYQFGDRYIIQGQFDRVLLRPLSTLQQVLTETFNLDALGNLAVGLTTLLIAKHQLQLSFSFGDYLWLILSGISGAIILLSVFVILASLSFHFEDRLGIAPPFHNLIAFGRYPVTIFSKTIQFVLSWIIPFSFIAFYPATFFFRDKGMGMMFIYTPVVALVCGAVALFFWNIGTKAYSSTGN
jgi:ABC-2 type transport system permease protein